MNELGDYLKSLRGKKSLRQASKDIGISHTYLDSLEKGYDPRTKKERSPTYDVLNKISTYYGVSYIELLKKAGYKEEARREDIMNFGKLYRKYTKKREDELTEFYKENDFDLEELLTYDTKLRLRGVHFNEEDKKNILKLLKDYAFNSPNIKDEEDDF